MGLPFTAGQRLTATDLNTATGFIAWTSYGPPAWTDSGTAPNIGNGSLLGYYMKIGRMVTVRVNIVGGSTTTWGSGNFYGLGLPFAAITQAGAEWNGSWHALRQGVAHHAGTAFITSGSSAVSAYVEGAVAQINPTSPATWATTDTMAFGITYETAS